VVNVLRYYSEENESMLLLCCPCWICESRKCVLKLGVKSKEKKTGVGPFVKVL